MKEMNHEQKIKYMTIAANVCGFGLREEHTDLLVSLYELVIEKEGEADLKAIAKIETEAKERADAKHRSALLDKVSEKV